MLSPDMFGQQWSGSEKCRRGILASTAGRAWGGRSLTRRDLNVGAVPELLGVGISITTHAHAHVDPVCRVGGALAVPRRRIELVVSGVLARVARVCVCAIDSTKRKVRACRGAEGDGGGGRGSRDRELSKTGGALGGFVEVLGGMMVGFTCYIQQVHVEGERINKIMRGMVVALVDSMLQVHVTHRHRPILPSSCQV